ncbi:hypothetical protein ACQJBY_072825 [Aegilops geniculata]
MPPRRDGAATPTTSPPPSPGGTPSATKGAGAAPPPSSPHPASKGPSAPGGTGTGDEAAATPPSSPRRGGSPPVASPSPAPVSCPASPRVHCGGRGSPPTASPPPASASCNTSPRVRVSLLELVATVHGKPAAGAHEEGGVSDMEKQLSSAPGGTGTGDAAAATPHSSLRCCGIPSAASTPPASASCPTSPRGSTPMASPSPRAGETVPEQVATGHGKPAGAHEREGLTVSVMGQTTGSDLVKTTTLFSSEQSQQKKDLDQREGKLKQWEQDLDGRAEEVGQREDDAMQRERRQYDMWLRLAEWETDLKRAQHAVLQGHARLSKWVNDVDAECTARMTTAPRMEDELRSDKSRTEAKQKEEEEKGSEDDEKEEEDEEVKHAHGCFGSGSFRRNCIGRAEPRDEASAALKQRLLMPQQSQSTPTPSDTPNPLIAEITAVTMRNSTPKAKVYHFESCLMPLRSGSPKTYGICSFPSLGQITSESKDPEMVKIGLRVLTRSSENLDERRLYSTIHEILKAVVAKYNASQLLTQQERVRWEIRKILTDQAQNFGIAIDGVSIVSLSFEKVFTQDIQEKEVTTQEDGQGNRTTQEAGQDNRSAMIRSQEDDQIWNKTQIGYIFDLGTALGIIFLIRPWLPSGYDRWIMAAFAAVWGMGSVGLPIGMFGTSRFEKNCSRHVGRFISLSFSLLVLYAIYILTLNVAGTPPTPSVSSLGITNGDGDGDADWWTTAGFIVIAALVAFGHLCSWIRGCCTGGDRDMLP